MHMKLWHPMVVATILDSTLVQISTVASVEEDQLLVACVLIPMDG